MSRRNTYPLRSLLPALLCALLAALAGCVNGDTGALPNTGGPHNLELTDSGGRVVMTAELQWPEGELTPGRNFTGLWRPLAVAKTVPQDWTLNPEGYAKYHAEIASASTSFDLSFGNADNNVFLLGTESNGVYTGQWLKSTLTGATVMGNFTLKTGQ